VALAPGAYEVLFVSLAHSDDDLARALDAAAHAASVALRS
jgi:glutamate-1-semialdehyde aminotransferase